MTTVVGILGVLKKINFSVLGNIRGPLIAWQFQRIRIFLCLRALMERAKCSSYAKFMILVVAYTVVSRMKVIKLERAMLLSG
jgi:hypothetical protein